MIGLTRAVEPSKTWITAIATLLTGPASMISLKTVFMSLMCCATFLSPAIARDLTEAEAAEAMDFAMHDAVFTVYHEIGHMLVHQFGLPVLGKEEDAADALAVILILNDKTDEIESYNTLIDSSDGWYFNALKSTGEGVEGLSYYDDHSLSIQRAYAMACMMIGADPKGYAQIAEAYEFDQDGQDNCASTYEQSYNSWMGLLNPHAGQSDKISIVYEKAGDYEAYADELKSRQVLEKAAALIESNYQLPGPVTFSAKLCDEPNAYYSPDDNEVIYCYELAADMYQLDVENAYSDDPA
jgi:hypothetical protein